MSQQLSSTLTHGDQGQCAQNDAVQKAMTMWLQAVSEWYPYRHSRSYFLPPIHFNRVPFDVVTVAGQPVLVLQRPSNQPSPKKPSSGPASVSATQPGSQVPGKPVAGSVWTPQSPTPTEVLDSDARDDSGTQHVLSCLRALAEKQGEVMMVISQLDFRKYLDDKTDPISTAACSFLPRPATMAPKKYHRGDFDVLIIHPHYGLVVGEVKSVGSDPGNTQDLGKAVVKRVRKAVGQLHKAQDVLSHLVSDMAPVKISKTLILPSISSSQLLQALSTDMTLAQELCDCLGASDVGVAVSQCLLSDSLSPAACYWEITDTVLTQLGCWWIRAVAAPGIAMTDQQYESLLARFCGPATTVDIPTLGTPRKVVRSEGQAVAETGLAVSSLALYPNQIDILSKGPERQVFLLGPPGTGKTVVLLLKAMQWLNQSGDVQVVSIGREGRVVSMLARQQLLKTQGEAPQGGTVQRHHYDFQLNPENVAAAVNKLASLSRDGCLNVIVDEVGQFVWKEFTEFCVQLHDAVPNLRLWAAGVKCPDPLPPWLQVEKLTLSIRCPPAVHREVARSGCIGTSVPSYDSLPTPSATDGPEVIWRQHTGQADHSEGPPRHCRRCGEVIAEVLKDLRVGASGQDSLQWRDVIIMCYKPSNTVGLVHGLNSRGIPVGILERNSPEEDVRDVALARTDQVTLTDYETVSGLERRIVVGITEGEWEERLLSMSRCTAQLVWIDPPPQL